MRQERLNNERAGITGALVYGDRQVMEGEEAAVRALCQRISQGKRHRDIFRLADKSLEERSFFN